MSYIELGGFMLNINNSIHGLQRASHNFNKSAEKISKINNDITSENNIDIEDKVSINSIENSNNAEEVDIAKEIISMNLSEISYQANAKTIKANDDMMGTIIDIKA